MHRIKLAAAIAGACLAASAYANPPQGVFTEVSPIAKRYPVTLVTVGAGECDTGRALALIDATGTEVMEPFVVPDKQKFVITAISWRATPNSFHPTFGPDESVHFFVKSTFSGGTKGYHPYLFSERQTAKSASGSMSYEAGPTYVQGTSFCAHAGVFGAANFGASVDLARVHGYIQDDAPEL